MLADKTEVPSYLVAVLGVEQDPAQLDDFCRVLGHIDTMLVAGGSYVDDDVAIEATAGSGGCRSHSAAKKKIWVLLMSEAGRSGTKDRTWVRAVAGGKLRQVQGKLDRVSRPDASRTSASDQVFTT